MSNTLEAKFNAIIGATGCGKTHELKKQLAKPARRRTLVWSPKEVIDNYAALYKGSVIVRTAAEVGKVLQAAGARGEFHLVFVPTLNRKRDEALFSVVCKMAMAAKNLTLIVDELHSVTTATHAPDGWVLVNFMGRGFGVEVFGLSQRPASVDKAFMASLSSIYCGRLPHPPDQKTMSEILGVDVSEVANLSGYESIQRNMLTKKITRPKPPAKPIKTGRA